MAISFISVESTDFVQRTSQTSLFAPAGVADDDIIIATILTGGVTEAPDPTFPAGFTEIGSASDVSAGGFNMELRVGLKVASSEPEYYTFTHSQAYTQASVSCFRGVDTSTPQDATSTLNTTSSTTRTWTGLTTATSGAWLVALGTDWADTTNNLTPPSGMTERLDITLTYIATEERATAGATGDRSHTSNTSSGGGGWNSARLIALRPIAASGISGDLTKTEAADAAASASALALAGVLTKTEAADTCTSAGALAAAGVLAKTEATDTSTSAGALATTAVLTKTEAADTGTATGSAPPLLGTLTATEAADGLSTAGALALLGTLTATEAADTQTSVSGLALAAVLTKSEAGDTGASVAVLALAGAAVPTEAADTVTASAGAGSTGVTDAAEAADTFASGGVLAVAAELTATEAADTGAATATLDVQGVLDTSEAADTVAADGVLYTIPEGPSLWVATTGSPGAAGTFSDPFDSIQDAVDAASPGTVIRVRAGTYDDQGIDITSGGTAGNPITLLSEDGRGAAILNPIPDPGISLFIETVRISGCPYVTLDGFRVNGPQYAETVHVTRDGADPDNIIIRNCDLYPDGGDGVKISHGTNINVLNNRVVGSTDEQGIDFVGVIDGLIANNDVSGIGSAEAAIQVKGGSLRVTIRENVVGPCSSSHGIRIGGGTGEGDIDEPALSAKYEAKDCIAERNKVEGVPGYALQAFAAFDSTFQDNWCLDTAALATNAGRVLQVASGPSAHNPAWPCGTVYYTGNGFSRTSPISSSSGTATQSGNTTDGSEPVPGTVYGIILAGVISGGAGLAEAADTADASGTLEDGLTGDLAAEEAADGMAAAGVLAVQADASTAEATDTADASGALAILGDTNVAEVADTVFATSGSGLVGFVASEEGADTAAADGSMSIAGELSGSEAADTLAAASGGELAAVLDAAEAADTAIGVGVLWISGTLAATDAADFPLMAGGAALPPQAVPDHRRFVARTADRRFVAPAAMRGRFVAPAAERHFVKE